MSATTGHPAITEWCPTCEQRCVPILTPARCGFCDTRVGKPKYGPVPPLLPWPREATLASKTKALLESIGTATARELADRLGHRREHVSAVLLRLEQRSMVRVAGERPAARRAGGSMGGHPAKVWEATR